MLKNKKPPKKDVKVSKAVKKPSTPTPVVKTPKGGSAKLPSSPEIKLNGLKIDIFDQPKMDIVVNNNSIHFNSDVTEESMSQLCKELRNMDELLSIISNNYKIDKIPIYLFIKTYGGDVYSVMSAIDCITSLKSPVYTIVDGFVASAGTLLSIIGEKRFIQPNAYVLIHEISSHVWGKMSNIIDEYSNLQKLTKHIKAYYAKRTKLSVKQLDTILKSDITWNAEEAIKYGIVDEIYKK